MQKNTIKVSGLDIEALAKQIEEQQNENERLRALVAAYEHGASKQKMFVDKDIVKKLREQGKSTTAIAKETGYTMRFVCAVCREMDVEYSPVKHDGVRKPTRQDSLKSYDDIAKLREYFFGKYEKTKRSIYLRDWAMLVIGVNTGLRISDIQNLHFRNFYNEDMEMQERITIKERKTGKLREVIITEAMKDAVATYVRSLKTHLYMNDPIFFVMRDGRIDRISRKSVYHNFQRAKEACGFDFHFGTHSMRKTFATAATVIARKRKWQMDAVTLVQNMLGHSNPQTTLRYIGVWNEETVRMQNEISDFILGKSDIKELKLYG